MLTAAAVACLLLSSVVRADEEPGEDYYDPELDADDLAERLADMPDSA